MDKDVVLAHPKIVTVNECSAIGGKRQNEVLFEADQEVEVFNRASFKLEYQLELHAPFPESSSRSASISARACWLPVRLAAAMPACSWANASSVRLSFASVCADIW